MDESHSYFPTNVRCRYFTTVRHGEEDPDITGVKHHYQLNDICEFFYCTRREPGSV